MSRDRPEPAALGPSSPRRPTFVTLFPGAHDYHLTKDVGMIPYLLGRYHGYDARIASFANDPSYPSLEQLSGLGFEAIPRSGDDDEADVLAYLGREAPGIDILQVYHWLPHVLARIGAYKAANPDGVAWLKLDANRTLAAKPFHRLFDRPRQEILRRCDLVTVETLELHERLGASWPVAVELVPNGFYDGGRRVPVPYAYKEDVVCTVGRIGAHEKATETLLEAFARASSLLSSYELRLVGGIEPEFTAWVDAFLERHPALRDRIVFTGQLRDRARVDAELRRARVFCLPSRWEGFAHVLVEALAAGCWIVCSDIPGAVDVTDGGRFGEIFPVDDVDALTTRLLRACTPGSESAAVCADAQDFAYRTFSWTEIAATVDRHLRRIRSGRAERSPRPASRAGGGSRGRGGAPSPL